jgi:predicted glycoside hydrolase/deacetylase ChbG (UPF0249 family)
MRLGERIAGAGLRRFATPSRRTSAGLVQSRDLDYAAAWSHLFAVVPARGVTEIVCHPAHPDARLRELTPTLVEERAVDLAALLDPGHRSALVDRGFELRSFIALDAR